MKRVFVVDYMMERNIKKSLELVDFGIKFLMECQKCLKQKNNSTEACLEIKIVKERCILMLEETFNQFIHGLPSTKNTFKSLSNLNPAVILNQVSRPAFFEMPFLYLAGDNTTTIEDQYRKLLFVDWREEGQFNTNEILTDTEQFWLGVLEHQSFKDLAIFDLPCLITAISNAVVEKIFFTSSIC